MPGDKSISHRYAMLAALAEGRSTFTNFAPGADCESTLTCLQALGCSVHRRPGGVVELQGTAGVLRPPRHALDCGNSGSTMRMLAGILAAQPFASELAGDASLSRRPMQRIIEPLSRMGASIEGTAEARPPLRITGGRLRGIEYHLPVPSAQVKTCLLFAGLLAEGETAVEETVRTRDHGELALRAFGAEVSRTRGRVLLAAGQTLHAIEAFVPGDISSAAFFLCAAAILPGSNLVLDAVGLNPTRAALLDVLTGMGARISVVGLEEHHGELVGTVRIGAAPLRGGHIAGVQAAALIDELPVLAAIAPYTSGGIEVRDARELRVKESDRIALVARNLRAMGARVEEREDGLRVPGGQRLRGAEVDSGGDHRIAMAFAVAALGAAGETMIQDPGCVDISFPGFFAALEQVAER